MEKESRKTPGSGRKKGVPNKMTQDLKAMIDGALMRAGGEDYLLEQAHANPVAFMNLVGKRLPKDITQDVTGTIALKASIIVNGKALEPRHTAKT
jgi:hypothetical protein